MRLTSIAAAVVLASASSFVAAAEPEPCTSQSCKAGSHARTFADKSDPYYACPSKELSDYITAVIGITALNLAAGTLPNVSDETGEPELSGKAKAVVDGYRSEARVHSLDEAVARCEPGANKRSVTVLNMPASPSAISAYVLDESRHKTYWLPIAHLDRQK
ncbi:hypothetical protein [Hydrocarboniphaga sp.]|uniref:hypothetical protein n=1 Tax=Hydrocarboniphaga sp. TaxID=2033016 RepID=UPI003D123CB0